MVLYSHRNPTCLPLAVYSSRLRLVQAWPGVIGVEANQESGDTKWPDTSGLGIFLHIHSLLCSS